MADQLKPWEIQSSQPPTGRTAPDTSGQLKPWEIQSAQPPTSGTISDLNIEVPGLSLPTTSATNSTATASQAHTPWEVVSAEAANRASRRERAQRAVQSGPPLLGGTNPTIDYQHRGPSLATSARNMALGLPVVRHLVPSTPEVEAFQRDFPSIAGPQRAGAGVSTMMLGGPLGAYSTALRSLLVGGGVGAADTGTEAAIAGDNPLEIARKTAIGGGIGAASAIPGILLGRLITPRADIPRAEAGAAHSSAVASELDLPLPRIPNMFPGLGTGPASATLQNAILAQLATNTIGAHPAWALAGLAPTVLRSPALIRAMERRGHALNYHSDEPLRWSGVNVHPLEGLFARYTMNSTLSDANKAILNQLLTTGTISAADTGISDGRDTLTGR